MAMDEFFPPRPPATPTIYAFASTRPDHAGLLKVGGTAKWKYGTGRKVRMTTCC